MVSLHLSHSLHLCLILIIIVCNDTTNKHVNPLQSSTSGPPKVTHLRAQKSMKVNNTHVNQRIEWKKVTSNNRNTNYIHYEIRYGSSSDVNNYNSPNIKNITSTTNSTALTLPLPRSPITYKVWVAAFGEKTGTGEYSEVLEIKYEGNV